MNSVVRERLSDARILNVEIEEDEDYDGDTVYQVAVVYDHDNGLVDEQKAAGLARHTRSRLGERNIFNFPIFRFVVQSEAKKLKAAAG